MTATYSEDAAWQHCSAIFGPRPKRGDTGAERGVYLITLGYPS